MQLRACAARDWALAQHTAAAILGVYREVYPPLSPAVALQKALVGKVDVYLAGELGERGGGGGGDVGFGEREKLRRGVRALGEGERELRMTFGAQHRVVADVERLIREVDMILRDAGAFVK